LPKKNGSGWIGAPRKGKGGSPRVTPTAPIWKEGGAKGTGGGDRVCEREYTCPKGTSPTVIDRGNEIPGVDGSQKKVSLRGKGETVKRKRT